MITKAEQQAEQRAAKDLIKKMNKPRKFTAYLKDPNNTVIQTNCIELQEGNQKVERFEKTAKIITNK